VWELETGRLLRTLEGHKGPVCSVAVTPDGAQIVSGSEDGTIKIWRIRSNELVFGSPGDFLSASFPRLTPSFLGEIVYPYLIAIDKLQLVLDEISGEKYQGMTINHISQKSPISFSLDGADKAIKTILSIFVRWRREHEEKMAKLAEQEARARIRVKHIEGLERQANIAKSRAEVEKLDAEAERLRQEAEKMRLENEKSRLEIQESLINLTRNTIQMNNPELSEMDETKHLVELLPAVETLAFSSCEVRPKELVKHTREEN
jgi:hypothetical protein